MIRGSPRKGYIDGGGKVMWCVYLRCEIDLEASLPNIKTYLARIYRLHDSQPRNQEDIDLSGSDKSLKG